MKGTAIYTIVTMASPRDDTTTRTRRLLRVGIKAVIIMYLSLLVLGTLLHYPKDTDRSYDPRAGTGSSHFYESAYAANNKNRGLDYEAFAREAADKFHITEMVQKFVSKYHIGDKRVLEVGSGRGYLQDVVRDYTGLDISASVAGHYHKPFVIGSATAMPFQDNSYDAIWSVWVLEHIPEPEKALAEMRRVLKPGGTLMLFPAWDCTPWAADGFNARPSSDFNAIGKMTKAAVGFYPEYDSTLRLPVRAGRLLQYALGEKTFHYRRLRPNYDVYWQADSDAAVSLDRFETFLWFRSRGDTCLNCSSTAREIGRNGDPLVIKIQK